MRPIRVFLVEDDVDFAEGLALILRHRGYEVGVANSGEEALNKFKHKDLDIVLLDFKLPGINGLEVLQETIKLKPEIKALLITGFNMEQILVQIVGNNCWRVLNKPQDKENIFDMIERIQPNGILITNDYPDLIETIVQLLEEKGKTIFFAKNSQEAVEHVQSNGIDILILDFDRPIINKLGVYVELKKIGRAITTIIVTPHVNEEKDIYEKLDNTSISGILKKPINPKELLEILKLMCANN